MKPKFLIWIAALALSGLMLNGCYTQVARPDREEEPRLAREAEPETEAEETSDTPYSGQTNVYIYGGGWYGHYWDPWWYRYPRSRFYVSVGFGYYDPWEWCGTAWDWWYDPWCWDRYHAYWRPHYGWYPTYGYYPYPYVVYRDRTTDNRKRGFTRRGMEPGDNSRPGVYSPAGTSGRESLAKPVSGTYARGNDGTYRRIRRDEASTKNLRQNPPATDSNRSREITNDRRRETRRSSGDIDNRNRSTVNRRGSSGESQPSVRRSPSPAPTHDSGSVSRRSGSSGSSGSGGSISKPSGSGSSGSGSAPKSSGNSSSKSGSSSNRRSRN